ncbi:gamma-glutamylcyclotransferase [Aureibaculum sp. 2210JD6-5]|uniref:gamma-glutamylcyclotransferase n=1 Tax=Aureibaculum sp. 2210JD6-5 TaxID=3103957 RepID=UPI002AAC63D1|nr:gamma-glutamylcyclotransferase [Aureibaculum sp. 2210JD6-5]MDY7396981.1 gamma-glutamylcyclotransferase [Aureibaculum sp. 2210JD6-5]
MIKENYLIFGYGSIIWDNKEIEPIEIIDAKLIGAHRSFNKKSTESRGTKANPGLVLGLEYGGECQGKLILISKKNYSKVLQREGGYIPHNTSNSKELKVVNTINDKIENCIVFFPRSNGPNFISSDVNLKQKAKIIQNGKKGKRGDSKEYLSEIRNYLQKNGIIDDEIEKLYKMVFNDIM